MPSPVVLSTVPAEAFLAVLEFLYTNSVKLYRHSVSPLGRDLGERGNGLKGRGNFLPLQPPTLQVLEVLTAAVEYGLEELRKVGLCGRPILFLLPLVHSVHTLLHTLCLGEEHMPLEKYEYLCVNRHVCVPVCQRICTRPVYAVGAQWVFMAGAVDTMISQP